MLYVHQYTHTIYFCFIFRLKRFEIGLVMRSGIVEGCVDCVW